MQAIHGYQQLYHFQNYIFPKAKDLKIPCNFVIIWSEKSLAMGMEPLYSRHTIFRNSLSNVRQKGNVLFNDALNPFYLQLYIASNI